MHFKLVRLICFALSLSTAAHGANETPAASAASRPLSASFVNSMALLNDEHPLAAGDQLSFRVIEDEDPPRSLIVTDSGEMEVPLIGRVHAAGKTCKAVANELKPALEREYYIKATVILGLDVISPKAAISKGKVYFSGAVRTTGAVDIPSDETFTLSKAIFRAGGFGDYANKRKVRVTRKIKGGGVEVKIVDLVDVIEKGKSAGDIILEPDDVIYVPERWATF